MARILRHSDPKVTFDTYAHLVPGYLHAQIDRLSFGPRTEPPQDLAETRQRAAASGFATPVLRGTTIAQAKPASSPEKSSVYEVGEEWALLDSNQWPSASEADALSI